MLKLFVRDETFAHPLADAEELRKVLAALPEKDNTRSIEELAGWLESVANSDGLTPAELIDISRRLDDAAQPFLRRLTIAFLAADGRGGDERQKLSGLCSTYYAFATEAFRYAIDSFTAAKIAKGRTRQVAAAVPMLPLLFARQLSLLAGAAKWRRFRHEPPAAGAWSALGRCFLEAEAAGVDGAPVSLYPHAPTSTSPRREYIAAVALEASSLDSLLPVQMEVAEKLLAHFSTKFVLSRENRADNVYWIDALSDRPPQRLTRLPQDTPGVRLLAFGEVPAALAEMSRAVERGDLPADIDLKRYTPKLVLSVLRHLAVYWASTPPLRRHKRHRVSSRMVVCNGFEVACGLARDHDGGPLDASLDPSTPFEVWQVGDVSMGGFGARLPGAPKVWLRVGAMVAMQPEGGGNWLVGVVRRWQRGNDHDTVVGVQTLARQGTRHELVASGIASRRGVLECALLIDGDEELADRRLLLAAGTFDLRESYTLNLAGRRVRLTPMVLEETGADFQIGRFAFRYVD